MAPDYFNGGTRTSTWGPIQQWYSAVGRVTRRTFTRLWVNLRDRDRYELARVERGPQWVSVRRLPVLALPRVRMYVLRINAAGRPGRRRRRLAVANA